MKLVANARVRFSIVSYLKSLRLVFLSFNRACQSVGISNLKTKENINSF